MSSGSKGVVGGGSYVGCKDLDNPEVVGGIVRGRGRGKYRKALIPELRMEPCEGVRVRSLPRLTSRNLEIWTYHVAGYRTRDIAKLFGITQRAVLGHLRACKLVLRKSLDLERMRKGLLMLYPEAMAALRKNLERAEPKTTVQYFKISGIAAPSKVSSRVVRVNLDAARADVMGSDGGGGVVPVEAVYVVDGGGGGGGGDEDDDD